MSTLQNNGIMGDFLTRSSSALCIASALDSLLSAPAISSHTASYSASENPVMLPVVKVTSSCERSTAPPEYCVEKPMSMPYASGVMHWKSMPITRAVPVVRGVEPVINPERYLSFLPEV